MRVDSKYRDSHPSCAHKLLDSFLGCCDIEKISNIEKNPVQKKKYIYCAYLQTSGTTSFLLKIRAYLLG